MQGIIKKQNYQSSLTKAFLLSMVLHLLILFFLNTFKNTDHFLNQDTIKVKLLSPVEPTKIIEQEKQQIVSTEKSLEVVPKKETNLKSEFNNQTEKESIKKGDPLAQTPQQIKVKQPKPEKQQIAEKKNTASEKNTSANLKLSEDQLSDATLEKKEAVDEKIVEDNVREHKFASIQPFSKNSIANIYSKFGSADYLPEIPDGDLTLLNTKADHFAVFVKRVGLQVFSALRKLSWQELARMEISQIRDFSEIEAILDTKGKLLELRFKNHSGSTSFDQILKQASNQGAWDQNPPAGAQASDGKIHFLFKGKTWARFSANGIGEQRWLLLGVGLL